MRVSSAAVAALGRRFRDSRRGVTAIIIGLALPVVIAMVGLGTEITFVLYKQRQMQLTADAAALGGATALQTGHPAVTTEALGISSFLGYVNGDVNGTTVTVNNPPTSGSQLNNNAAVEVLISQPQTLSMVSLFHTGPFNAGARAVAIEGNTGDCILQVGNNGSGAFTMGNGAVANLTQCGVAVDSANSSALSMNGSAQLNATSVSVVGSDSITNGATINPASALLTSQASVPDPYANVTMPAYSGCGQGTNKSYGHGTWGLSPGVYCNGLAFTNDAIVTMSAGVYFVDRGTFSVGGAVQLTGTGVTIVLTSSTGSGYATVSISNGATVTLSAPTSGATAGMVFFGDRSAPLATSNSFAGGSAVNIDGAVYFPSETLVFQNGASNPSGCTQLIAGVVQLVGGSEYRNNCPTGVAAIGGSGSKLAE
jgi:hypothetical protein